MVRGCIPAAAGGSSREDQLRPCNQQDRLQQSAERGRSDATAPELGPDESTNHRSRAGPSASRDAVAARTIIATSGVSAASGVHTVNVPDTGVLLRIFIGESDKDPEHGRPLYEAIVRRAREAQLAGATVLRGVMGYGRHSRVHTAKFLEMSMDLPIVIEIADAEDKVNAFLPVVDELVTEGLVTLEAIRIVRYVSPEPAPGAG
jgi:PII-like signaling protein